MQSKLFLKEEKLPSGMVVYTIPDKVRWDGWWLTLPTLPTACAA
jgi:hypothetical protein